MRKLLFSLSCTVGLLCNSVQANPEYSQEQLQQILQEELTQLQQTSKSKKIVGERVDFKLPKHMQLAFMAGNPKDRFMAEYISKKEKVESWKSDFIAQQRSKLPLQVLALLSIQGIQNACPAPNLYSSISRLTQEPSRIIFTYFCKVPQTQAPFGEGGVMTFLQGSDYVFKFWSSWRPQSESDFQEFAALNADTGQERKMNLGIDPVKYAELFHLATSLEVCNPQAKVRCKFSR